MLLAQYDPLNPVLVRSSINKARLRCDVFFHVICGVLMSLRLMPWLLSLSGHSIAELHCRNLPHPRLWEAAWLCSLAPSYLAWRSTSSNSTYLLKFYIVGTVIFGILPIMYGVLDLWQDVWVYLNDRLYNAVIYGAPAVLVWIVFFFVCIQIHGLGLYFSFVLLKAWRSRGIILKGK